MSERLSYCLDQGGLVLPETGTLALIGVAGDADLSALPLERCTALSTWAPDAARLAARGLPVTQALTGPHAATLLTLPRARDLAQSRLAEACAATAEGGLVIVDGAKTDGIDSLLKAVRARVPVLGQVSKAHGRVFWFDRTDAFADWRRGPRDIGDGFVTAPGVFSADGPDPASVALLAALPDTLGRDVADLGGGWGLLSRGLLQKPGVQTVYLVEADADALACARQNLQDPRLRFFWADVPGWEPPAFMDSVVMNPPFHSGRQGDPALGQAFIDAAARMLKPSGHLWMVANRHLPYEATLASRFRTVQELGGTARFKILHAADKPRTRR